MHKRRREPGYCNHVATIANVIAEGVPDASLLDRRQVRRGWVEEESHASGYSLRFINRLVFLLVVVGPLLPRSSLLEDDDDDDENEKKDVALLSIARAIRGGGTQSSDG